MPPRRLLPRLAALLISALLWVSLPGLLAPAHAATSRYVVADEDGDMQAIVQFNSGMHYYHAEGKEGPGVNSFQIVDVCSDGLRPGVVWRDGEGSHMFVVEEDCSFVPHGPLRYTAVPTGYAPREMEEMSWWTVLKDEDGNVEGPLGDIQYDWMGSYSHQADAEYFPSTSVYMDYGAKSEKDVVVSMIPSAKAVTGTAGGATEEMWQELLDRTPLPEDITAGERSSLYKQLWCHAEYAFTPINGGETWDLEVGRPDISWELVKKGVGLHECNWGDDGTTPTYYYPPTDGGADAPQDLAPVVEAGPDRKGDEGTSVTLAGQVWDDGGAPRTTWSYTPLDGVDEGATCTFEEASRPRTGFSCTDDGTYRVTLTADDGVNRPVRDTALVTLANVAPKASLTGPKEWEVYRVGDSVRLSVPFTDDGTNDTHVCKITWDDGDVSSFPAQERTCEAEHTFEEAGMNTIKVEVTDDDTGSDAVQSMVVVYDPRSGLLTALGTVDKLGFTATAKYPFTSSTSPAGSVALTVPLDDGHFTLVSTDLDWLVITPDAKAAFKGRSADHGFLGYVEAGKFRGVVWPLSEGDVPPPTPLYDSTPGADWDIDRAEPRSVTTGIAVIDSGWIPGLPELPLLPGLAGAGPTTGLDARS